MESIRWLPNAKPSDSEALLWLLCGSSVAPLKLLWSSSETSLPHWKAARRRQRKFINANHLGQEDKKRRLLESKTKRKLSTNRRLLLIADFHAAAQCHLEEPLEKQVLANAPGSRSNREATRQINRKENQFAYGQFNLVVYALYTLARHRTSHSTSPSTSTPLSCFTFSFWQILPENALHRRKFAAKFGGRSKRC